MDTETLQINYEITPGQFRKIWLHYFKKSLPGFFAFWGTGIVLSLLALYFFDDKLLPFLVTLIFVLIPFSQTIFGYQSFMKTAKDGFAELSKEERNVRLTFQKGVDGFDCVSGKSFSHTSWESIKNVEELNDYFVFSNAGNVSYIPKTAFRDDSEIKFLRFLISVNVGKNVKLLK